MIPRIFSIVFAASAILMHAATAKTTFAQPLSVYSDSLEWQVAEADVVVRASLVKVAIGPSDGAHGGSRWKILTLKIHETLKGVAAKTLTIATEPGNGDEIYEQWKGAASEQLWFLARNKEYGVKSGTKEKGIAARYPLKPCYNDKHSSLPCISLPVPGEPERLRFHDAVITMRLDVLREPKDVLLAAKAAVAEGDKRDRAFGHLIDADALRHLTVPIDHRLEELARRMIQSPGDFLAGSSMQPQGRRRQSWLWGRDTQDARSRLRVEGAKALRYFKSDENVAILKPLLDDPACQYGSYGNDEQLAAIQGHYYVRDAALVALSGWGVKVAQPVLKEWAPRDRVLRAANLPENGRTVGKRGSKVEYYFTNRHLMGNDANARKPPGLYRSDDGGATWKLWCSEFEFEEWFVHPETGVLYAAIDAPQLQADKDGFLHAASRGSKAVMSVDGKHWKDITPGCGVVPTILEFEVNPDHPQRVCMCTGYCTGSTIREQMAYVLQAKDDRYSQWNWYLVGDFAKRKESQPFRTE